MSTILGDHPSSIAFVVVVLVVAVYVSVLGYCVCVSSLFSPHDPFAHNFLRHLTINAQRTFFRFALLFHIPMVRLRHTVISN